MGKLRRYPAEKILRVAALLIEIHADDGEAFARVLALHLVHPREGFAAGPAPGGPEIDVGDLAGHRHRLSSRHGAERERRRRFPGFECMGGCRSGEQTGGEQAAHGFREERHRRFPCCDSCRNRGRIRTVGGTGQAIQLLRREFWVWRKEILLIPITFWRRTASRFVHTANGRCCRHRPAASVR